MKEKKYDLYFENSVKVKSLNDDYFKCYQEIEKCLFKKRKDVLKTNILLSEILDQMKSFQDQGKTVQQVMTKGSQAFVDQIDRKINYKEMVKQRYTLDDLLLELRYKSIKSIEDVEYAILENNGKLSIFKYNFLKLNTTTPFPIILDGVIQKDTLKYLKKNEKWVYELLEKERVVLQDVFYAFYKNKKTFIIKQSEVNSIE